MHLLCLPKVMVRAPEELTKGHLPLFHEMRRYIEDFETGVRRRLHDALVGKVWGGRTEPVMDMPVRWGFHTNPSQSQLHCHIWVYTCIYTCLCTWFYTFPYTSFYVHVCALVCAHVYTHVYVPFCVL